MTGKQLISKIASPGAGEVFAELYGADEVETARQRYTKLVEGMKDRGFSETGRDAPTIFDERELRVFSAPGRTELGGNHTDHNCGKVLAASVQLDKAAIVWERPDKTIFFRSDGHRDVSVCLADSAAMQARQEEQGKTEALIRGIAAELHRRGTSAGGFSANAHSTVMPGSGLSSSAAVEVLLGKIFDCLYGDGTRSAPELARIGQIAENDFFGKPCGLMDQIACASGGAVAINFAQAPDAPAPSPDTQLPGDGPQIQCINFNPAAVGYVLCVVNTAGSHANLTPEYTAIPAEMKAVAAFFGKGVLAELNREAVLSAAADVRKAAGDRALLRAIHFFDENDRVDGMALALKDMDKAACTDAKHSTFRRFMELVNESGDSSWQLLQNIYPPAAESHTADKQGISVALALSKEFFRRHKIEGACRVHGGGFAGTIQAYIPLDALTAYRQYIEAVFGANSLTALRIRPLGAVELEL